MRKKKEKRRRRRNKEGILKARLAGTVASRLGQVREGGKEGGEEEEGRRE